MIGDIDYLSSDKYNSVIIQKNIRERRNYNGETLSKEEIKEIVQKQSPDIDIEKILKSVDQFNAITSSNERVELYYNKDINRVIISIVDKETDEVIREIPCKEIQNLAKYLREELGNLYDKKA
ncbi:MAG TPA: flagellar protein FlaG [Spirochaetota bacterium]|nr:flagellar protein FlaG [Spirochaetota bacterium]HOL57280.1 flagellar protein FlaG [Spirochaetota bacterium]HPP04830.1 flagellar protein FlaG [Spirochaetota bacterium]